MLYFTPDRTIVIFIPDRSMVIFTQIEPWLHLLTLYIEHHGEVGFPLVVFGLHGVGSAVCSLHSRDIQHGSLKIKLPLKTTT